MFEYEHLSWCSHKIKVSDSKGLLKIRMSEGLNYIEYKSPFAFGWTNDGPATFLCDYVTSLPLSWSLKEQLNANLNEGLIGDEKQWNLLALKKIKPILDVFENGTYGIYYLNALNKSKLIFPAEIEKPKDKANFLNDCDEVYSDNPEFDEDTLLIEPYEDSVALIATQKIIKLERVEFYEEQIRLGKRPFAIVFSSFYEDIIQNRDGSETDASLFSNFYVIDGHHKLMAYKNAGVEPPIIFITHFPADLSDIQPDMEGIYNTVQPYHFAAMMRYLKTENAVYWSQIRV